MAECEFTLRRRNCIPMATLRACLRRSRDLRRSLRGRHSHYRGCLHHLRRENTTSSRRHAPGRHDHAGQERSWAPKPGRQKRLRREDRSGRWISSCQTLHPIAVGCPGKATPIPCLIGLSFQLGSCPNPGQKTRCNRGSNRDGKPAYRRNGKGLPYGIAEARASDSHEFLAGSAPTRSGGPDTSKELGAFQK